ncbi:carotenoid oxygenase [Lasiosphaeris hirsuta]|uniref:Carotenoid oxygenase n=1 Tax=Lasiosphaeris hirsuta TaxID=260670 RepID=A0AA40A2K1_9PEZI|nr:carotenoid oxygenase [Lasiosphaeris hirsuta]
MDLVGNTTRAEPIRRLGIDEKHDLEAVVSNLAAEAYKDWPNEAGFDSLTEERGPIEISVSGHIPAWAGGSLYRTGPGVYKIEDTAVGTFYTTHWFDGLAHTHRFDITPDGQSGTKMFYSSRRQSEQMAEHIKQFGDRKYFSFGQRRDPCLGLFAKIMSSWVAMRARPADKGFENISVAVHLNLPGVVAQPTGSPASQIHTPGIAGGHRVGIPQKMWITTDNCIMKQFDSETLEPIGFATQESLHPDLTGPTSCAHAQRDPLTGDMFNFNLQMGRNPTYRIFRVSAATGKTDILAAIQGPGIHAAYMHSFYLSPSFVIFCIPSSHLGLRGLKVLWERNMLDAIEPFDESKKCKWFVIDRLHGRGVVAEFETDAGFFFHSVNSFEEQDDADTIVGATTLFCDVVEYPNLEIMSSLYYDVLLQKNGAEKKFWGDPQRARAALGRLVRYRIHIPLFQEPGGSHDLSFSKILSIPAPHAGELPTINPRFATKRHRYVYSIAFFGRSTLMDCIVKTDMETREALFWNTPPGHSPGEAIFVPRPDGVAEDDGVLLSVVLDGSSRTSYVVCLDARTMAELGRGEVGFAVGLGFHGLHVAGSP